MVLAIKKIALQLQVSDTTATKYVKMKDNEIPKEYISKREKVKKITQEQLNEVIKKYPIIAQLFEILSDFRSILTDKKSDELLEWIDKARKLKIKEIDSFISGVLGDYDSVINAITYRYNNGLAEGSVNKLKNIKRVMYGRNHFELLRCKVLQLEALKQ